MKIGKEASVAGLLVFGTTTSLFSKIGMRSNSSIAAHELNHPRIRSVRAAKHRAEWRGQVLPEAVGDDDAHVCG
jgi:hypothetical protein